MTRFRSYPRRAYVKLMRGWLRRNVKLLAGFAGVAVALLAIETVVILVVLPDTSFRTWLLGATQATIVAIGLYLVHSTFLVREREAIWQLRGAWGEEATRDELRRAKRKRVVWGWIDSIEFQAGDLDHLVLPRKGGFVVIDSKWRSDGADAIEMAASARRARLRAEGLTRTLLKSERGSHRAKGNTVSVIPLVVIWGPAQHQVPDGCHVEGVDFIRGRALVSWLEAVRGSEVDRAAAKEALALLRQFRGRASEGKPSIPTSGRSAAQA